MLCLLVSNIFMGIYQNLLKLLRDVDRFIDKVDTFDEIFVFYVKATNVIHASTFLVNIVKSVENLGSFVVIQKSCVVISLV